MKKDSLLVVARGSSVDELRWARIARAAASEPCIPEVGAPPRQAPFVLVVPTANAYLRVDRIPSVDADEIEAISANLLEENAPLDPADMVFANEVLSVGDDSSLVLSAAIPVSEADALLAAAKADVGDVVHVDVAVLGLLRALAAREELGERGRRLLLAEENGRLLLVLLENGQPLVIRALGALSHLASGAVATAARMALLEAEFAAGEDLPLLAPITLLGAGNAAFADAICAALHTPAPIALDAASLPNALNGAALRAFDDGALNLFPETWNAALDHRRFASRFRLGGLVALVAWIGLAAWLWGTPMLLKAQLSSAQEESARLAPGETVVNDLRERIKMIDRYSDRSNSPLEVLREICLALPRGAGITLTSMHYDASKREATVAANAPSSTPAYDFSNRLKESPLFPRNAIVSGPTENRSSRKTDFSLRIEIADGSTPSATANGGSAQ